MEKTKILVVEDEGIVARDLERNLGDLGYSVPAVAASGEEAIQKALDARPDLVLMDIVLRGKMDGVEAAEEIRARLGIPVVYLTAFADEATLQRAKITEPFGYLLKPFQAQELKSTIEIALFKSRMDKERKMAEEALRRSEEKFKELFDGAPVGYHEYDPQGRITNINRTELEMLGLTREEIIGQPVWKLALEEEKSRQAVLAKLAGILPPARGFERAYRRKDGTTFPVLLEDRLLQNERGEISGIRTAVQNITERKILESQLAQAQKLEAVGQLAAGIAHDFNNTLSVVMGNADMILLTLDPSNPLYPAIVEIKKVTEKAAHLTRQILAFSRRQILQPTILNVPDLVANFSKILHRLIGEDVELKLNLAPDLGNVCADPTALEQVLMNLALNARDAMPRGGSLSIRGQNVQLNDSFCRQYPFIKPGTYVFLSVVDTGVGMETQVLQRIFEPFFTTKETGTGLGLAVVYGIIKQHEGYIIASSRPGQGAKFDIYLPRWKEPATPEVPKAWTKSIPGGRETLLVAEDDEMVRNLLRNFLERLGYRILAAADGEEAWKLFLVHSREIDLVMSDAVMPGLTGLTLYERVQQVDIAIPFLLVTGYSEEILRRQYFFYNSGIPIIFKPLDFQSLGNKLRELLDQRLRFGKTGSKNQGPLGKIAEIVE